MSRHNTWSAVILAVGLLLPAAAAAQAPSGPGATRDYDALISEAVREFDAAHWTEARAIFLRAHELRPNARTLRALGFVEFELRNYARADEYLRQALANTNNALTAEQRRAVTDVLARIEGFLGHYRIESTPDAVKVIVDGAAASYAEDGTLVLEAGARALTFSAPSYAPHERRVDVRGGERGTLRVDLAPEEGRARGPATPGAIRDEDGDEESDGTTQRILGWIGVGAGVVGLGAGVVLQLDRASKLSEADAICPTGDCGPISAQELSQNNALIRQLTRDADSSGTIGVVALAAGGALAIAGVVLVLTAPSDGPEVAVVPVVAPGLYGASATVPFL